MLTNVEEYDEVLDDSFANMTETVTSLSQVKRGAYNQMIWG